MPWILKSPDGDDVDYAARSRLRVLDDALGCLTWGHAGGGLFQTYDFIAAPAVARGDLVEVLPAYRGRSRRFSLVYPQNRHLSARVRGVCRLHDDAVEATHRGKCVERLPQRFPR